MFSLRSISIKGAIALIALAAPATVHAQINPANQINWPTGAAGCVYAPGTNTCVAGGSATGVLHSGIGAPGEGTAATVTQVSSQVALSGSSSASISGVSITSGQVIVVTVAGETNWPAVTTLTDTLGTTYTQVSFNGNQATTAFWIGKAIASGSDTITWNPANTINGTISADVFSSGASTYVDAIGAAVVNAANPSTSVVNRLSGDLVIGGGAWIWSNGVGLTFTAGSGFTLGSTFPASGVENPTATEYDLSGTSGSQTVAISQASNTGSESSFGAFSLFAVHTGSVGNDGDFYLNTANGQLYGPRLAGVYMPTGNNLQAMAPDGTTMSCTNGICSVISAPSNFTNQTGSISATGCTISATPPYTCTVGTAVAGVSLYNIPTTYLNLQIEVWGSLSGSSQEDIFFQLGHGSVDTGNDYLFQVTYSGPSSGTTLSYGTGGTLGAYGDCGTLGTNGSAGSFTLFINNYGSTAEGKIVNSSGGAQFASGQTKVYQMLGVWTNTASEVAINAIRIYPQAGNFNVGTAFTVHLIN